MAVEKKKRGVSIVLHHYREGKGTIYRAWHGRGEKTSTWTASFIYRKIKRSVQHWGLSQRPMGKKRRLGLEKRRREGHIVSFVELLGMLGSASWGEGVRGYPCTPKKTSQWAFSRALV